MKLPKDLYISPDALRIFLEAFEGPLDLLLYLIRQHNIDILDIPIAEITRQYMQFINLMHEMKLEVVADYLVMAAMLAEIKSRLLLPCSTIKKEESDPRVELVSCLKNYEPYKKVAYDLDTLPRIERDMFIADAAAPPMDIIVYPVVELTELLRALNEVLERASLSKSHSIKGKSLSIRDKMSFILLVLRKKSFISFTELFSFEEGRIGVVVTLIALLELIRQSIIELLQPEPFGIIHICSRRVVR